MVTVHQSSVVLGTGSTFFVPQGEFCYFLFILYLLWAYPTLRTRVFFFLACDICGEMLVGLAADTSSVRAEATGCEATRKC